MRKIILIVPSLTKGGVERIVSILSKELNKYYDVYVIIYHGPIEYEIEGNLINLETPSGSLWRKIKNTFNSFRFFMEKDKKYFLQSYEIKNINKRDFAGLYRFLYGKFATYFNFQANDSQYTL